MHTKIRRFIISTGPKNDAILGVCIFTNEMGVNPLEHVYCSWQNGSTVTQYPNMKFVEDMCYEMDWNFRWFDE